MSQQSGGNLVTKDELNVGQTDYHSMFEHLEPAPSDPIFGIKQRYLKDPNPEKVDLSAGVYQDIDGKTPKLAVVSEAERRLFEAKSSGKLASFAEYLPIDGLKAYDQAVQTLVFGKSSPVVLQKRIAVLQSIGGTGALRCGAEFLIRYFPKSKVYISDPSWPNHRAIFERAGFEVGLYPYYNSQTQQVDIAKLLACLKGLNKGDIVLLHDCCHNPTGLDLTQDEWIQIANVVLERQLVPFIDFAYQGLGDGIEQDAFPVRKFAELGLTFLVANSFSKNFSMYNRRLGSLSLVCASAKEAEIALSQAKTDARTMISNPPLDGAEIVAFILADSGLNQAWQEELAGMCSRIKQIRLSLIEALNKNGVGGKFKHILSQNGMFSFSGLTSAQVDRLEKEFSVYLCQDGRISIASLSERKVEQVARAIATVVS